MARRVRSVRSGQSGPVRTRNRRTVAVAALADYLVTAAIHLVSHAFTSPAGGDHADPGHPVVAHGVLGRVGALGGALFFVSDAMIAIGAFAPTSIVPHTDELVMATYIAGRLLIVAAVLAATAGRTGHLGSSTGSDNRKR